MSLEAGTKLGPYEISAPIGAGGMGEVYRAKDTRLGRDVAVKVLPAHMSSSPELRQRLEREAKTISQLSHPHICMLHDVGHQNGTDYLVMEFLEGETLADRLAKGALPIEQALRIGIEIAGALDAAHRSGIVHRDLKPGNIMLTKTGVKLLDFGLAKLAAPTTRRVAGDEPADGAAGEPAADLARDDPRDVPVHVARAARGRRGRRAQRHLRLRLRALRDADGTEGVHGQEPGEPDRLDHEHRAASDLVDPADDPAGAGPRRQGLPRQGARAPLEHGARRDAAAPVDRGGRVGWRGCRRPSPRGARAARSWRGASRPRPLLAAAALAYGFVRRAPKPPPLMRFEIAVPPNVTSIDVPRISPRRADPGVQRDRHGREGPDLGPASERARGAAAAGHGRRQCAPSGRRTAGSSASWPTASSRRSTSREGRPPRSATRTGHPTEPGARRA